MDPLIGPIARELKGFERRLNAVLRADVELAHEIARYLATLKGKRLRPVLVLLSAKATGTWDERVIDAAVAVELIHAATMIHDDVVDAATMRRGKASVNFAWSDQLAVLMGDFLLARALCLLVDLGDFQALQTVSRATERLSVGEIFEIQIGQACDTRQESYFSMVSDKTASLISAAVRIGAILAGAAPEIVSTMGQYGEELGRAFQIADDILDFIGDADVLGKPVGHDLRGGKITLPLIHALAAASEGERRTVETLLQKPQKSAAEWAQIVDFVVRHEGVAAANASARQCAAHARRCLEVLAPSPARTALEVAVERVVERKY